MRYVKVTKSDTICNICRKEYDKLSFDHVPPKGGINLSDMEVINYCNPQFGTNFKQKNIIQSGLRFRTLCKNCNNNLGAKYDDCFNTLMRDTKNYLLSEIILPDEISIETYPTKILKSLLGHIIASNIDIGDGRFYNTIREYVSDKATILPKFIKVYFWVYRYNCTIIKNDSILRTSEGKIKIYSLLKSFPLAFAVFFEGEMDGVEELTSYNNNDENQRRSIKIRINQLFDYDYPESEESKGILLTSLKTNHILAVPRKSK